MVPFFNETYCFNVISFARKVQQKVNSNHSQFYTKYPSEKCETKDCEQEIGSFEDLDMVCALAFSRNNPSYKLLCDTENGIFVWNEKMEKIVNNVNFKNVKTLNEKNFTWLDT